MTRIKLRRSTLFSTNAAAMDRLGDLDVDIWRCVHVSAAMVGDATVAAFRAWFVDAVPVWAHRQTRAVWLQLNKAQIVRGLLACALSHDFPIPMEMHHAQQEYVMLIAVLQLPASIPPYCTTHVGAGGFVVNRSGQVLVVADRRPDRPDNFWKLPGGVVEHTESIATGVEREVLEETGVSCKFETILMIRHNLAFRFERGDLYFICLCVLPPDYDDAAPLQAPSDEIAACRWIDLDEFLNLKHMQRYLGPYVNVLRAAAAGSRIGLSVVGASPDAQLYTPVDSTSSSPSAL